MKTPEEIKKGLRFCSREHQSAEPLCNICPYDDGGFNMVACTGHLSQDALAYIKQLEQEFAAVKLINDATQCRADALEDALKHQKKQYAKLLETASILSDAVDELEKEGQSND